MSRLVAKVCGLTTAEDADMALRAGADLLGFVVHPLSPRHCSDVRAAAAPVKDRAVLVMVADDVESLLRQADRAGVRRIQPHVPHGLREEVARTLTAEGLEVWMPWADEPGQRSVAVDRFLWEPSPSQTGVAGGSGQTHAMAYPPPGPFLLAGGLGPDSLLQRLEAVPVSARAQLMGVDAASRLELYPGRKDPHKVTTFLSLLHSWNETHAHRV